MVAVFRLSGVVYRFVARHTPSEAGLAGNAVEAAYARTDHFERRRALMDSWADYLSE